MSARSGRAHIAAVIFDLGGTLLDWNDWDGEVPGRWQRAFDLLEASALYRELPGRDAFVAAMVEAEEAHWRRVVAEHWSGPPSSLVSAGLRALDMHVSEAAILPILDAYARSVDRTAFVFPDTRQVLEELRGRGYRLGLLSNTWWAAEWHNADLATHGLSGLLDELVYTSDLPHSKPHPAVFLHTAALLEAQPSECLMVGDWPEYDIAGAVNAGMRAIWKTNGRERAEPPAISATATIAHLAELPALIEQLQG
jgi:putative hydrolase of the HAD superfamily